MTNLNHTSNQRLLEHTRPEGSRVARLLLRLITWYQQVRTGRIAPCRFYPSCSQYAAEAISTHGALKGGGFTLRRLSKCRPLGPHGIDLVPEAKKDRKNTP